MGRISAVLIVAILFLAVFATRMSSSLDLQAAHAAANAPAPIAGDIDCSGAVDALDAMAALRELAGISTPGCGAVKDVNCSGAFGLDDIIDLRRHIADVPRSAPGGCAPIGSPIDLGEPSISRIQAALDAGSITRGQALLYFIQADLDAQALPAAFRGASDGHLESSIFHEVATRWDSLSAGEQAALIPYLISPDSPNHYTQNRPGVRSFPGVWEKKIGDHANVWWQPERAEDEWKAIVVLDEIETAIWPDVTTYMGRTPLSDASSPENGGDGKFDIYLMHNEPDAPGQQPVRGYATPRMGANGSFACKQTPAYLVLNSRHDISESFLSTVAHEFMHAIQFSYSVGSCDDYRWLFESTAVWVESWLYPEVNDERIYAEYYLDQLSVPLETWKYKDYRQYGSYLFWYHMQHNEGRFYAVRDTWNASANPDSLVAVNTGVGGSEGLKHSWPESALFNWNRAPYEDFTVLDGLFPGAKRTETEVTANKVSASYPFATDLGHMQQSHQQFNIGAGVKTLTVINPFGSTYEEYAKLQAIVEINGQWEPVARDWTNQDRITFCFDRPEERVTQLVLVLTNSNYLDRAHTFDVGPGEIVASPMGCKGWSGTATAEVLYGDAKFTMHVGSMRFAPQVEPPDDPGDRFDHFDLVEVTGATWTVSGVWPGGCIPSGTMVLDQPGTPGGAHGDITVDRDNNTYFIHANGGKPGATFTITCKEGSWQQRWPAIPWIWNGGLYDTPLKDEGGTFVMDGEHSEPGFYGGTWRWRLTEVE